MLKAQVKDHVNASDHHAMASKHHIEASKCCESGDQKTAAHHAQIAHAHSNQAVEHGDAANKKYAASPLAQK